MYSEISENIKKIREISDIKTETLKAVEELSELIRVLSRIVDADYKTFNKNRENLIEEIADVEVMLKLMKDFYKVDPLIVRGMMIYKTERTLERIGADGKG